MHAIILCVHIHHSIYFFIILGDEIRCFLVEDSLDRLWRCVECEWMEYDTSEEYMDISLSLSLS